MKSSKNLRSSILAIALSCAAFLSLEAFALPVYTYDPSVTHTQTTTPKWRWSLLSGQEVKNDVGGDYILQSTLGGAMAWQQISVCLKSFGGAEDLDAFGNPLPPMLPTDQVAAQVSLINMDLNPDGTHASTYGQYYFNTAINSWNNQCETFTFINGIHLFHRVKLLVKAHNLGPNTASAMITTTISAI